MESPVLNVENWVTLFTLLWRYLWPSCGGSGAYEHCWREWTVTNIRSEAVLNEIRDVYKLQRTLTQLLKGLHSRMFVIVLFVLGTTGDNLSVHHQKIGRVKCGRRILQNTVKQLKANDQKHTYLS